MTSLLLFLVGSIYLFLGQVNAAKVRGTVNLADSQGFAFLGKFCFQYLPSSNFSAKTSPPAGFVDIELINNGDAGANYSLVLYDDQADSWPKVYQSSLKCQERVSKPYARWIEPLALKKAETFYKTLGIHQHIRPRWWRLYLTSCDTYDDDNLRPKLTTIDYEVHFRQNVTSWLKIEVGSNDQGLNIMHSVYLAIYVILFGVQLYAYYVYTIQQYIHQVIKLLTACIGLQLFGVAFHFADWMIFTQSGEHELFFPVIANLCEIIAASVFLLLLLVLAQGWTVSRFEVMYPKLVLASVLMCALVECSLYVWSIIGLDEETTVFLYNTTPQLIYGIVFALLGVVYIGTCLWSHHNEPLASKRNLYILLCILFSFWFLWPLARILIGEVLFKPWNIDTAVLSISLTITTLTYFMMMLLMWPSHAHQYFNLTMIDTQRMMLEDSDTSGAQKKPDYKVLEQDRL